MLWDVGLGTELIGHPTVQENGSTAIVTEGLVSELHRIGVAPGDIAIVAVSRKHYDHIDQAADFFKARRMIGRQDWDAVVAPGAPDEAARRSRRGPRAVRQW